MIFSDWFESLPKLLFKLPDSKKDNEKYFIEGFKYARANNLKLEEALDEWRKND